MKLLHSFESTSSPLNFITRAYNSKHISKISVSDVNSDSYFATAAHVVKAVKVIFVAVKVIFVGVNVVFVDVKVIFVAVKVIVVKAVNAIVVKVVKVIIGTTSTSSTRFIEPFEAKHTNSDGMPFVKIEVGFGHYNELDIVVNRLECFTVVVATGFDTFVVTFDMMDKD